MLPNLIVSGLQSSLFWEDKNANMAMFSEKIASLPASHIIVLPEMFTTGFTMHPKPLAEPMQGQTHIWLQQQAAKKKAIITGTVIIEEHNKYYNRLLWVLPTGETGIYDKKHLFAFAGENKAYSAGNKRSIATVGGWRIMVQICYDLRFPVWVRQQVATNDGKPEYDVLIFVANWPEKRKQAWITLLKARAIENQCYVIAVNRVGTDGNGHYYSGNSCIIDPLGNELLHIENEESAFTYSLSYELLQQLRNQFPFLQDADDFRLLQ